MPTKPNPTPDTIDAELVAAQAEASRLADKAAAIREAGEATRAAVELARLREDYATLTKSAREARNAATAELDAVAQAAELDLPALLAAFDRRQQLDAECGAVAGHVARLNQIDPLPPLPNGVERFRPPQCQRLSAGAQFSNFIDHLITSRADAAEAKWTNQLRDELHDTVEAAEQAARQQAAELADGKRLQVDAPEAIVEKYRRAIADVNDDQLDAEAVAAGGLNAARNAARKRRLDTLLAEEAGGDEDQAADAGAEVGAAK